MVRDTSKLSYLELIKEKKLTPAQKEVLNIVLINPDKTDRELCSICGINDPNELRPRRNELYHKGIVKEGLKRKCAITGKLAYTWFVPQLTLL